MAALRASLRSRSSRRSRSSWRTWSRSSSRASGPRSARRRGRQSLDTRANAVRECFAQCDACFEWNLWSSTHDALTIFCGSASPLDTAAGVEAEGCACGGPRGLPARLDGDARDAPHRGRAKRARGQEPTFIPSQSQKYRSSCCFALFHISNAACKYFSSTVIPCTIPEVAPRVAPAGNTLTTT